MPRLLLSAGLVAIAVVGALPFYRWMAPAREAQSAAKGGDDKRPNVVVSPPAKKTIHRKLDLPGNAVPDQQVSIYGRVPGYLKSIEVDRGSWVKARDPLASIAVPELEKELEKQKAELAECPALVERDRATLAWRESVFKRLDELRTKTPNLVNGEMFDEAKGKFEIAKADLAVTTARGESLRAAAERTQALVDLATLRAPFDGVVTGRWVDPGELIQPGTTKLVELMKIDRLRLRIAVPEIDVPFVKEGNVAKVSFLELPGRAYDAPVARIFWALNPGTKTMWTEIDVENKDRAVRPGMFGKVRLDLDAHENVMVLPAAALVAEKKKMFVFVVKDGVAKKTPIVLGFDDGIEFEVKEGVAADDEVIVSGKNMVSDGAEVRTTRKEYK